MVRLVKPKDNLPWPLWHEGAGLLHFPILKNAHSSLSDRLKGKPYLFEMYIRDEWPGDVVASFAVIRHPVDRYISALAQMFRMDMAPGQSWEAFIDGVERWNRERSKPWTCRGDRHFLPQSLTVDRMPEPRRLFPMGHWSELWAYLVSYGFNAFREPLDYQKQTPEAWHLHARDTLSVGIIERHYATDLGMWGSWAA